MRFAGRVKITVRAVEETRNVTLHSKDLTIHLVKIRQLKPSATAYASAGTTTAATGETRKDADFALIPENEFLVLTWPDVLRKDREYVIEIHFNGSSVEGESKGFFRASENVFATQFGPTFARRAFPCFDEPHLKATFKISVSCDQRLDVISNMEPIAGRLLFFGQFDEVKKL